VGNRTNLIKGGGGGGGGGGSIEVDCSKGGKRKNTETKQAEATLEHGLTGSAPSGLAPRVEGVRESRVTTRPDNREGTKGIRKRKPRGGQPEVETAGEPEPAGTELGVPQNKGSSRKEHREATSVGQ